MSFAKHLPKLARFSVNRITLAVSEKYARRVLKIKKGEPLVWHGIPLNCIGSARYRQFHQLDVESPDPRTTKP